MFDSEGYQKNYFYGKRKPNICVLSLFIKESLVLTRSSVSVLLGPLKMPVLSLLKKFSEFGDTAFVLKIEEKKEKFKLNLK